VLLDNRHGLVANIRVTAAPGTAEREAALLLLAEASRATVGGGSLRRRQSGRPRSAFGITSM